MIDSSVALRWVLPDEGTAVADSYFDDPRSVAPDVILVEVANVLAKKVRARDISGDAAHVALGFVISGVGNIEPSVPPIPRALELSVALSHPVYDCVFLACAERLGFKLVTHDDVFSKRVNERGFGHLLLAGAA